MPSPASPSIVTANLLSTGEVVYLAPEGDWVADIAAAEIAGDKAGLARLETWAAASVAEQRVLAVYALDVAVTGGIPRPISARERIRAAHGPSVQPEQTSKVPHVSL